MPDHFLNSAPLSILLLLPIPKGGKFDTNDDHCSLHSVFENCYIPKSHVFEIDKKSLCVSTLSKSNR